MVENARRAGRSWLRPRRLLAVAALCVLLGGGGFVDGYSTHPQAKPYFDFFAKIGVSKDLMKPWLSSIDPITCAANLKDRKLLIMAASRDDVVPPSMATNRRGLRKYRRERNRQTPL